MAQRGLPKFQSKLRGTYENLFSGGGHTHNDELSFELHVGGQDFIVDPGTYTYTGDYRFRNSFRSSYSHNTVVVDKKEINNFSEREIFKLRKQSKPSPSFLLIGHDIP